MQENTEKFYMKILKLTASDNLQDILDSIDEPTTVYLKSGVYRRKLKIRADDVTIIGEGRETTVITFDDYAKKDHPDGREYNTFRTYTVCVTGERVTLENLTVENSNREPEKVGQCVALSVNAKSFLARNVDLRSTQDTLFTAPFPDDLVVRYSGITDDPTYYDGFIPRDELYMQGNAVHLFDNCRIYGTVDYVFGCAEAYFTNCIFVSLAEKRGAGYVAAPAHSLKQETGYVFIGCKFEDGGASAGSCYLARPWRDFGKCDFINCTVGKHVSPLLFDRWNDTYRDRTARFSYDRLDCGFPLTPVPWCAQMDKERAKDLVEQCEAAFAAFEKTILD